MKPNTEPKSSVYKIQVSPIPPPTIPNEHFCRPIKAAS